MTDSVELNSSNNANSMRCEVSFRRPADDMLLVELAGSWTIHDGLPPVASVQEQIVTGSTIQCLAFEAKGLTAWDSALLAFLLKVIDQCDGSRIRVDRDGLPSGVRRLLNLATAVPETTGARRKSVREPFLSRIGTTAIDLSESFREMQCFLGEAALALVKLLRGKARFRSCDLFLTIQECGAGALPIVTLISFLVGLILAFIGAIQLLQFGAQIYVADLVGIAMAREMGAMMTAIVMAGRTGAAFAAELGTMTVNEEIDALETLGFSPMEFLVLPRMLALALMMPLLCLYADLVGIVGGALVGVCMLDLSLMEYVNETRLALSLVDFSVGISKSLVFGIIVALSGCLRGMKCGRSSAAVGLATTSAVVTAIVLIIVTDAVFAVVTNVIGV